MMFANNSKLFNLRSALLSLGYKTDAIIEAIEGEFHAAMVDQLAFIARSFGGAKGWTTYDGRHISNLPELEAPTQITMTVSGYHLHPTSDGAGWSPDINAVGWKEDLSF